MVRACNEAKQPLYLKGEICQSMLIYTGGSSVKRSGPYNEMLDSKNRKFLPSSPPESPE